MIRNAVLGQLLQMILSDTSSNDNDSEETHNVQCNACDEKPIESDRYKCLTCKDVNFCAQCFERRREFGDHKSGHPYAHFKSPGELFGQPVTDDQVTYDKLKRKYGEEVHDSISCDGCLSPNITGLRFKCDNCPNYDLCQRCVEQSKKTKSHQTSHPLIMVPRRAIQQIPVEDIQVGDELGSGAFGMYDSFR